MATYDPKPTTSTDSEKNLLEKAMRQARWNNILMAALILISGFGFVYLFFIPKPGSIVDEHALMEAASERIAKNSVDIVAEATGLAAESGPQVANAFTSQFREDIPLYFNTLENQGEELIENMEDTLRAKLKVKYKTFLKKHQKILAEEIPEVGSKEALEELTGAFEKATDRLIEKYYIDRFKKEAKRAITLWKNIEPIDVAKLPEKEKDLQRQLLEDFADWLTLRLKDETLDRQIFE